MTRMLAPEYSSQDKKAFAGAKRCRYTGNHVESFTKNFEAFYFRGPL